MRALKILMITAELAPLAKAGGLADMVAGLSRQLARRGHDVRVVLPAYGTSRARPPAAARVRDLQVAAVRHAGTHPAWSLLALPAAAGEAKVYLVDSPAFYGEDAIYGRGDDEARRFAMLSHAALSACDLLGWHPDVVHCHDWHAALGVLLLEGPRGLRAGWQSTSSVLTIHNIGYQGAFPAALLDDLGMDGHHHLWPAEDLSDGYVNFLGAGIRRADALTTVSPTHAREILSPEYGMGLDPLLRRRTHRLTGILNGVDYDAWNPATDTALAANFDLDKPEGRPRCASALRARLGLAPRECPLVGMVSRLAPQKGVHLVIEAMPEFLASGRVQAVLLGDGDPEAVAALRSLAGRFPGDCAFVAGHDESLARQIYGGADLFLVPSLYEPCGLTQLYALRYGAVPVVRATGGLADTVRHFDPDTGEGTGSVFLHADANGLRWALGEALRWHADPPAWRRLRENGMREDFSWAHQAPRYESLYLTLAD